MHLNDSQELGFRVSSTHALTSTATTLYGAEDAVDVGGSAPSLMSEDITAGFLLTSLDQVDVREHAIGLKGLRELVCDRSVGVETC